MSTQSSAKAVLRHAEHPWQSDVLVSEEYTSFATMQESVLPPDLPLQPPPGSPSPHPHPPPSP